MLGVHDDVGRGGTEGGGDEVGEDLFHGFRGRGRGRGRLTRQPRDKGKVEERVED
jgi:hypothetical protein